MHRDELGTYIDVSPNIIVDKPSRRVSNESLADEAGVRCFCLFNYYTKGIYVFIRKPYRIPTHRIVRPVLSVHNPTRHLRSAYTRKVDASRDFCYIFSERAALEGDTLPDFLF